jgi:hypothetical protein
MASNGFPRTHLAITSISCKCGGNMIGWQLIVGSNNQMHSNLLIFASSMCAFSSLYFLQKSQDKIDEVFRNYICMYYPCLFTLKIMFIYIESKSMIIWN